MNRFFNADNWLWKPFGRVADLFLLNCLWLLCSLPVITIGAATCALYDCTARCLHGDDTALFARFFRTLRAELLPGICQAFLWAIPVLGGYRLLWQYGKVSGTGDGAVIVAVALLLLWSCLPGMAVLAFLIQSRFTMTVPAVALAAVRIGLGRLPILLPVGLGIVIVIWLTLRFWLPVLLAPALLAQLWWLLLEPVLQSYMKE